MLVDQIFVVDHKPILGEQIPATVCDRCGERITSRETVERIRRMIHEESRPVKSIAMEVYSFVCMVI